MQNQPGSNNQGNASPKAVEELTKLGATVVDVDIPYIEHAASASGVLHLAEAAAHHDDVYFGTPHLFTPRDAQEPPCGFLVSGLPVGLQIIGRPFEESTVLTVTHAFQEATDWHLKRPNLQTCP